MTKLYLLNIKDIKKVDEDFCQHHFPNRLKKAKKCQNYEDYLCKIGAGLLLYNQLGLEDKDIFFGSHGKPMAKDVFFSISHSGCYVILAVGDSQIGADIQSPQPYIQNVAKRIFSCAENDYAQKNDGGFCRLWSLKESVMKCDGRGLSMGASTFDVMPFLEKKSQIICGNELFGRVLDFENYSIAICQKSPIEDVKLQQVAYN